MQYSFLFFIDSLKVLLPYDFYLIPLVFFAFLFLVAIVKNLFYFGSGGEE